MDSAICQGMWFIPLSTKMEAESGSTVGFESDVVYSTFDKKGSNTHFESDVVYSTFDKICGLFHFRKTTHKDEWFEIIYFSICTDW